MTLFSKGRRILALWFPNLPADRLMRRRMGRSWRSRTPDRHAATPASGMVFSTRERNTQRVAALDEGARRLGLRKGLGVAEARAMHPTVEVVEADPAADLRLLEALADWCDRYTPLVALCGDDGLFLDITGCAHLYGGECAMLGDVSARFSQQGFDARAAIASTPGAAWAAARYAGGSMIDAGEEAAFFAPLPLAALRLDETVCAGLESVGLRIAGAIVNAPRAPLVRRFGRSVTLRVDQALGNVEESISPRLPVPALMVERPFGEPIVLMEDIENLILLLSRQLKLDLERRGEGAEKLQLQLFRSDGVVFRVGISASRPLRDPTLIQKLFHEKLAVAGDDIDPGYGFDLVRLAVMAAARVEDGQTALGQREHDPVHDLSMFADRVRARLGPQAIAMPRMVESHWPEKAAQLASFGGGGAASAVSMSPVLRDQAPARERPLRLFASLEQVEVTAAELPEGPPARFRWRSISYRVVSAEGPERIEPEWWRDEKAAGVRDYFRVEDDAGRRYWLFREGRYGEAGRQPRWFVQGLFA